MSLPLSGCHTVLPTGRTPATTAATARDQHFGLLVPILPYVPKQKAEKLLLRCAHSWQKIVPFSKSLVQVSTTGVDEAHQYMLQQTQQLVAQAKMRGGLKAEVGL